MFNWKFIKEIERPRIVSVRVAPLVDQDNMFGQLIVRLRTQQVSNCFIMLNIYNYFNVDNGCI